MSPLKVEAFNPDNSRWVRVNEVMPHDPLGSLSNNLADGKRELYVFGCDDDDFRSMIYRSTAGVDTLVGRDTFRKLITSGLEVVKELKKGDSHEIEIKTDISSVPRKVRFTHI